MKKALERVLKALGGSAVLAVLLVAVLFRCDVSRTCHETKKGYDEALGHENLIPLTVSDLKGMMCSGDEMYNIVVIYRVCVDSDLEYVRSVVMPYYERLADRGNVKLMLVNHDCAMLKRIEPFFESAEIGLPMYYLRDNSRDFIAHGELSEEARHRNIIQSLYPGSCAMSGGRSDALLCLVGERNGRLKLVEYSYRDEASGCIRSAVRPCPVHYLGMWMAQVDFGSAAKVKVEQPNDDRFMFYDFR